WKFLSTLPARGATAGPTGEQLAQEISIHAPREGSDRAAQPFPAGHADFYPRSPRGERRPGLAAPGTAAPFLSTLPARGATLQVYKEAGRTPISIHAPREGSDLLRGVRQQDQPSTFLSTLPARGATWTPGT